MAVWVIINAELCVNQDDVSEPFRRIPTGNVSKDAPTYMCLADLLQAKLPPNSGQDNLRSIVITEAAYRFVVENRVVSWEEMEIE